MHSLTQELPSNRAWRFALQSLLFILAICLLFSLTENPVLAHSRLVTSSPESGTARASMPDEIALTFSEEIDLTFSAASLVTVLGDKIETGILTTSDADLVLHIPIADPSSALPGTYTLVWRVLSAKDGHVSTGTVTFSAGTGVAPVASASGSVNRPPWWRIAIKWAQLSLLIITVGGFAFSRLILRRPLAEQGLSSAQFRAWAAAGLGGALLLAGYDLAISASGGRFVEPPGLSVFRDVLFQSSVGRSWLITTLCAAGFIFLSLTAARWNARPSLVEWSGLILGSVAMLAVSSGGHASATSTPWRSTAIDWIHLSSVTFWLGGLPYLWLFAAAFRPSIRADRATDAAAIVGRFSRYGLGLMVLIIATGFLRAADQIDGSRSLVQSDYGRTLIAKHLMLLPILIAAGANLLVVVPRLKRASESGVAVATSNALRTTRHFISAEILSALFLLIAAGALTELAPAQGPLAVDVATRPSTVDQTSVAGDLNVWLLGRLTGASNDRITITLTDTAGRTPSDLQKVIIATAITIGDETIGDRFDAQPLTGSAGVYVFPALRLGLRGEWSIEVIVRRAGTEDVSTVFPLDTTSTGAQPPRLVDDQWRMPHFPFLSWFFAACALLVLAGGVLAVRLLPGIEPFAVAIILTMVALIATGFAVQGYRRAIPVTAGTELSNPILADAGSIARGSDLYTMVCLECHGPGGGGIDNNNPDHLHPGGTNLTDARTTGQRDGDLYWSMSNGIGGTDMPAFDAALSESERWDLVNYLRTLTAADAERALSESR